MSNSNESQQDISDFKIEVNLLTYRLTTIENKIDNSLDNLSKKIHDMISHYSETKSKQALTNQSLDQVKSDIGKIETKVTKLESDMTTLQVTFAEKLAYGGVGGGAVAISIEVLKKLLES